MPFCASLSRIFRFLCCLLLMAGIGLTPTRATQAAGLSRTAAEKISPDLAEEMQAAAPDDRLAVIVTLASQAEPAALAALAAQGEGSSPSERLIRGLQARAETAQVGLRVMVDAHQAAGEVSDVTAFWIFDGMALHATPELIREVAARTDVTSIRPEVIIPTPQTFTAEASSTPTAALSLIGASELWALGVRGQGIVVANIDSGVDVTHPALAGNWRGGSNSWYDPTTSTPTSYPVDNSGHGTATMGIMVGGDADVTANGVTTTTALGVAPDAKWIAARIFNGPSASEVNIHLAFQWILDPDHNTATDDAPQVVNNSWADSLVKCDTSNAFQSDLQALVAAGILPVFAAGNYGPNASTQRTPASRPEAFPVGSVDAKDVIARSSSRGPNTCGVSSYHGSAIYPALVAPGQGVRVAWLNGGTMDQVGTSFAAPHVAGGLALLLSADTRLRNVPTSERAMEEARILMDAADDLGDAGADNTYGYGRLNLIRAYRALVHSYQVNLPVIQKQPEIWNYYYYFPLFLNP
jgi:subtilisin family serine protease